MAERCLQSHRGPVIKLDQSPKQLRPELKSQFLSVICDCISIALYKHDASPNREVGIPAKILEFVIRKPSRKSSILPLVRMNLEITTLSKAGGFRNISS